MQGCRDAGCYIPPGHPGYRTVSLYTPPCPTLGTPLLLPVHAVPQQGVAQLSATGSWALILRLSLGEVNLALLLLYSC